MASLGELTAGIAHEIQNPLNFVNNFSEVNQEMIEELQTELKSGNTNEAIEISNDIKANEENCLLYTSPLPSAPYSFSIKARLITN